MCLLLLFLVESQNKDDSPCNNWVGVKCNPRSNRVSDLVLDGFGLSGKLGRGLLQLQFLRKLSLARNNLTGSISLSFSELSDLRVLDLSENGFSGSIPSDFFSQCGSLRSISLAKNRFSGPIPESLGSCSTLASLNLSGNQFRGHCLWDSGHCEIPKGIEALNNLRAISLRNNQLTGEVPDGIGNCLLLRSIDLSRNLLSGGLPSTMQKLSLCNDLVLGDNGFMGEVPQWIGDMRSLVTIDLSENNFTGQVPDSLGKLQSVKILNVSKNALTGSLPEAMSNCVNLLAFDISHNSLTGTLPSWVFKLGLQQVLLSDNGLSGSIDDALASSKENSRTKLLILDVSQNKLSGEIPSSVGDLGSLQLLNMSRNSFVGTIPARIGQLKSLSILDLSENQLNGSIPSEIGLLKSLNELSLEKNSCGGPTNLYCAVIQDLIHPLAILSLAHNEITGAIPASLAKLTYLTIVDFSFNRLTGSIPKQLANLASLQLFNISHNQLQVNRSCPTVLPKPIVLNPNSTDATPGTITQSLGRGKKILSISALIAIGAAAAIVIGVIAITVLNLRVRAATSRSAVALNFSGGDDFSHSPSTDGDSGKLVMFSGDPDFSTATHALLNKDCELGRGGFGAVYRTMLGDGRSVAIKKLTVSSLVKSQEDFDREVKKLGKVHHGNLVALHGYYWTPSLQLLIYEFVSGGNLYKHLHEGSAESYLSWNERFNIILGAAKGLAHLHQMNIIHYNLKSSNILIDSSGEPKVADYGLAKLLPMLDRYVLSSKIQSALGYMAPEFACKTVKITEKCDVYGFGILVLEVVTGKRPVEYMEDDVVVLSDMVRGAMEEGKVEDCVDARLLGKFPVDEAIPVIKLGLICTSQVPSNRPDMAEVVNILELIRCPSESQDELGEFS
ncbi:UNVERIFIED_CONTAM: putative LRR receptor-like serine/threonine-protein kinase IRK [Sesamum angustifolium]|uniref:LRR receptor-like serine/threonine-protein kinase IRK n=1 Tax=Sesamum angustifolium TaxID=2727405 RepID=A0AAW2PS54_9LAMI